MIAVLTDPALLDTLSDFTPEEHALVSLAVMNRVLPEEFNKIIPYYTNSHITCNIDTILN